MYLRTISTQPVDYIENNFTLEELNGSVSPVITAKLIDKAEVGSTIIIKDYRTNTVITNKYNASLEV